MSDIPESNCHQVLPRYTRRWLSKQKKQKKPPRAGPSPSKRKRDVGPQKRVASAGYNLHRQSLMQQLHALRASRSQAAEEGTENLDSEENDEWENVPMEMDEFPRPDSDILNVNTVNIDSDLSDEEDLEQKPRKPRRTAPDEASEILYRRWRELLRALESPWTEYWKSFSSTDHASSSILGPSIPSCSTTGCAKPLRTVLALYWDRR